MPSQLDVCNRALSILGTRSTIASMTEASDEALQCSIHYVPVLQGLLRIHLWSFAWKQAPLGLLLAAGGTPENPNYVGNNPPQPWAYEYAWPNDCVRVRGIYPLMTMTPSGTVLAGASNAVYPYLAANAVPFSIGLDQDAVGNPIKVILTNEDQAVIEYTAYVSNPNLWDYEFVEAFVYLLAARLTGPLDGDKTLQANFLKEAQQVILDARVADGSENPSSPEHIPDWIQCRGYASQGFWQVGGQDEMTQYLNSMMIN